MLDIALLLLPWVINMALTYGIIALDRRRLPALQRARAWNSASLGAALAFFAPFCIVAHFWVTRRSALGILIGILWFAAQLAALTLVGLLLDLVLPMS